MLKETKRLAKSTCLGLGVCAATIASAATEYSQLNDLSNMSLEQLLNIEVTSVTNMKQHLTSAAAAIEVISAEEIARSGARNLPELLKNVTGMQVAQINGRSWAISARGFNGSLADKLEVRLDGRSLYTPLFSGVIWEAQNIPLELIERIEVIRGPGASVWGANAVNGVVNITTKSASAMDSSVLQLRHGNELKREIYAQQGAHFGDAGAWRVYAQARQHAGTNQPAGTSWSDQLESHAAGVRGDIEFPQGHQLTVSLNVQDADMGSASATPGSEESIRGSDLIVRWKHQVSEHGHLQTQLSLDQSERVIPGWFGEDRQQSDLDFRYHFHWHQHELITGVGWRRSEDRITNGPVAIFQPAERALDTVNVFVQDRIPLSETLTLNIGSKFEHNDYTGAEVQPSARLHWQAAQDHNLWIAASHATRSPNRVDRDYFVIPPDPNAIQIVGNESFSAEEADVIELGWRARLSNTLNLDVASFYADYDKLRGVHLLDSTHARVSNEGAGRSFGGELQVLWGPSSAWQFKLGYSYLNLDFAAKPGSSDFSIAGSNENDPRHQAVLHTYWSPDPSWQIDSTLRYVGALADRQTPSYTELDVHASYQLRAGLKVELGGLNLLDSGHAEFAPEALGSIPREYYLGIRWELR